MFGFSEEKLFVAHKTVEVFDNFESKTVNKDSLLYAKKNLDFIKEL